MTPRTFASALAALLLTAAAARADDDHAGHHPTAAQVGTVHFANSCTPAAQADLLRGMAMLHSFWYSAGEQAFRATLAKDPGCAIADWGIAALLMNNPLAGVGATAKGAEQAQAAVADARRIGAKTQRERDYIDALATYYDDFANRLEKARQAARSKAYEALAAKYPKDEEAQIFSALYIAGTQAQSDQTYAAYGRAAAILQKEYAKNPNHPGISHYLIHVYDAPPLAQQGLKAARAYAGLAPDAPHAQHMPSHIFTRVGAWEDSAAANAKSFKAALPGKEFGEAYHASDYMVYADLQLGRDKAALAQMQAVRQVTVPPAGVPAAAYSSAAMPARYALERGDWAAAAALQPVPNGLPYTDAMTWFAKALGAARSGDAVAAEQAAGELATAHDKLAKAGNTYWATEVEIQQRSAAAWIALARKHNDEALAQQREAADIEDKNEKHIVTPGRLVPARELLGDMLVEAGQPAAALKEYEASQLREPNRYRGFAGAARAAEAAGDRAKTKLYYGKLIALTKTADSPRPELVRARTYAAR